MVSNQSVQDQLKSIGFTTNRWNRAECIELAAIILPEEKIFECVNGWYEGGIALLCATDIRILLVDKKPLRFLTVEDLRFDTINQIDYSHRLMDAQINVSAGMKALNFRSYNKDRLRKLIGHVQHRMAEIKTQQQTQSVRQQEHLRQIDQQLQTYMIAQYQQQESIKRQINNQAYLHPSLETRPYVVVQKPVIQENNISSVSKELGHDFTSASTDIKSPTYASSPIEENYVISKQELYNEGIKEIYSKRALLAAQHAASVSSAPTILYDGTSGNDINPLRIAYSQLVEIIKNRKHSHVNTFSVE